MRLQYSPSINRRTNRRTFKQWLRDWLNDSGVEYGVVDEDRVSPCQPTNGISFRNDRGIQFKVFKAAGGTIIETSFYDRQKDREINSLHVIIDGEDIGKALGKIITMETLKL